MLGSSSSSAGDTGPPNGEKVTSVKCKTIDKNGFIRPVAVASIFRPATVEPQDVLVPGKRRFSALIGDLTPSPESSFISSQEFARRRQSWDTRSVPQFGQNLLRNRNSPLKETTSTENNGVAESCVESCPSVNGESVVDRPERRVRVRPIKDTIESNSVPNEPSSEPAVWTNGTTEDLVIVKGDVLRKRNALLQNNDVSKPETPPAQRRISRGYHVTKLLDNLSESDVNFFKPKKPDSVKSATLPTPTTPVTSKRPVLVQNEILDINSNVSKPFENCKETTTAEGPRRRIQEGLNDISKEGFSAVRTRNRVFGETKGLSQINGDSSVVNGNSSPSETLLETPQVSGVASISPNLKDSSKVRRRGVVFDNIDISAVNGNSSDNKETVIRRKFPTTTQVTQQESKSIDSSISRNVVVQKALSSQNIEYKVSKVSSDVQSCTITKSSELRQETTQPDKATCPQITEKLKSHEVHKDTSIAKVSSVETPVTTEACVSKNSPNTTTQISPNANPEKKSTVFPPDEQIEDTPKNVRLTRRTSDLIAFKIQNIFSKASSDKEPPKPKSKPDPAKRNTIVIPNQLESKSPVELTSAKTETMKFVESKGVKEQETSSKNEMKASTEITEKLVTCKETVAVKSPMVSAVKSSVALNDKASICPQNKLLTDAASTKVTCVETVKSSAINVKTPIDSKSTDENPRIAIPSTAPAQCMQVPPTLKKAQIVKENVTSLSSPIVQQKMMTMTTAEKLITSSSSVVQQKMMTASNTEKLTSSSPMVQQKLMTASSTEKLTSSSPMVQQKMMMMGSSTEKLSTSSPKTKKKLVKSPKTESPVTIRKLQEVPPNHQPDHNLHIAPLVPDQINSTVTSAVPQIVTEKNRIITASVSAVPRIEPQSTSLLRQQIPTAPISPTTQLSTTKPDIPNGRGISSSPINLDSSSFHIRPRPDFDSPFKRHSSYISSSCSSTLGSSVESFSSLKDDDVPTSGSDRPRPPERRRIGVPRDPSAPPPIPPHIAIARTSSLKRFEDSKFLLDRPRLVHRSPSHSCVPSSLTPHRYSYTEMLSKLCSYGLSPTTSSLPGMYNQKYNNRGSLSQVSELWSDLTQEQTSSAHAAEILEAETTERMKLEKEVQDLQSRYTHVQQKSDKMEMEMMEARVYRSSSGVNGDLSEDEGDCSTSIYQEKYERAVRDMEIMKRRIQQQHNEEVEQNLLNKKTTDKKLAETLEDVEEERQVASQWKRKAQKLGSELQDLSLMLEEQMARNGELEKKQRRFDAELSSCQEEIKKERSAREKAVRDRDQVFQEKYSLEQELLSTRSDMDMQHEKITQLNRELDELTLSSKGEEEVTQLKRAKQELERKSRDQEEELEELAGQVQMLEQAKLRLEMSLEKLRQEHRRESSVREEEIEELRASFSKKIKNLEAQVETEQEERHQLVKQKHELERRVIELTDQPPLQDPEIERRLRRDLKRTKALLRDAQSTLEHVRDAQGNKSIIRQLKNQLEDAEFAKCAAVKAKQTAETELQDLQSQLEEVTRTKNDMESRCLQLSREKSAIQTQLEEVEEEMTEVMKKYKSAVAQMSIDQKTMAEQNQQITELEMERHSLKEQLSEVSSRFEHLAGQSEDSHKVHRLDARVRELESKLELEQTTRSRLDHQITRLKEQIERAQEECDNLRNKELQSQEGVRRYQRQIRDLREDYSTLQRKEADAYRKQHELEMAFEASEGDLKVTKNDLRLACQRIEELKNALEDDLDSGTDVPDSGSDSDSSSYEMALLRQNLTPIQRCDSISSDLSFGSRRSVTPSIGQDFSAMCREMLRQRSMDFHK